MQNSVQHLFEKKDEHDAQVDQVSNGQMNEGVRYFVRLNLFPLMTNHDNAWNKQAWENLHFLFFWIPQVPYTELLQGFKLLALWEHDLYGFEQHVWSSWIIVVTIAKFSVTDVLMFWKVSSY